MYLMRDSFSNGASILLQAAYKEWLRAHANEPPLEYDKFFATPIQLLEDGPTTIAEILEAHHALCAQMARRCERCKGEEGRRRQCIWPNEQPWKINPIFKAVIIVVDICTSKEIDRTAAGKLSLDDLLINQSVLLVRSRDESELSAPISFEGLQPFPIEHCSAPESGMIRVSLGTAINFMAKLSEREERERMNRFEDWLLLPNDVDLKIKYIGLAAWSSLLKDWAESSEKSYKKEKAFSCIDHAKGNGIDQVFELPETERELEAEKRGIYSVFDAIRKVVAARANKEVTKNEVPSYWYTSRWA
jgi:hypothetical protein